MLKQSTAGTSSSMNRQVTEMEICAEVDPYRRRVERALTVPIQWGAETKPNQQNTTNQQGEPALGHWRQKSTLILTPGLPYLLSAIR